MVLHLPRSIKRAIVLLVDAGACVLSVYLSFYLRLGEWVTLRTNSDIWNILLVAEVSVAICLPIFLFNGLYRQIFRYSGSYALLKLVRALVFYSVPFMIIFTFIGVERVPRTIGILQPIILLLLAGGIRAIASLWLTNPYRKYLKITSLPHVLIYGSGDAGRQLAAALSHSYEMRVVGFLDDDPLLIGRVLSGLHIYDPRNLINIAASLDVKLVLLAIPSVGRAKRNQIIQNIKDAKLAVQTLPSMSDLAHGRVVANDLRALDVDDLLGRDLVLPNVELLSKNTFKKNILITGAGGSIGGELCRQIIDLEPEVIILVDQSEYALYQIHQEMEATIVALQNSSITLIPILASVTNIEQMHLIIRRWDPHIIYHAAAYKHVPLVEANVIEGIQNNVIGTLVLAQAAIALEVPYFILISTDKAVRPTNVMGASKRLAEMVLQALAFSTTSTRTLFAMVRFGNVLDSSGSVVPKFRQQIKNGGPVTVTDFRMTRYFMTIPEAAQLVIQAGALAAGGDVFLLDMGQPVKIVDLARRMIELSGFDVTDSENPQGDIEVKEIGLRPGEKLYEELLIEGHPEKTSHQRIFKSNEEFLPWEDLQVKIEQIVNAINTCNQNELLALLKEVVSGYQPSSPG